MCDGVFFLQEALQETKVKLSATIDAINKQSGCPLTPRDKDGVAVDCQQTSILDLWRLVRPSHTHTLTHPHPSHTHTLTHPYTLTLIEYTVCR